MIRALLVAVLVLVAGGARAQCTPSTAPAPVWCETFTAYSGGDNVTVTAPKLVQPYQDAQSLGGGIINNGTPCVSGTFLTLGGAHVGDHVIGSPGNTSSCGGIPLGFAFDFGQIILSTGGPNGTMSATAGFGGVNNVNLTAFRGDAQGNCNIAGTTLTVTNTTAGSFDVGQLISTNTTPASNGTYIIAYLGGGNYQVNVSQTVASTVCTGSLWGIVNGPNARVFGSTSPFGNNAVGVGTTGTAADSARMFTENIQEGFVAEDVYFTAGTKTDWDNSGPSIRNIDNSGTVPAIANGIQLYFYSNLGPANTIDVHYGTGAACAATGSPFSFTPATTAHLVMAWRSAADASGYIKIYWGGVLVASATGNNRASPCNLPATLNATDLIAQGSAASPAAEWFADNIGVYDVPYNPSPSGPTVRLVQ